MLISRRWLLFLIVLIFVFYNVETKLALSFSSQSTPQLIESAVDRKEIDRETANLYLAYAIGEHDKLPVEYQSNVAWHGTAYLLRLQNEVATMKRQKERMTVERILSTTCDSYSVGAMPYSVNSTYFYIEYDSIYGGLTLNDYITSLDNSWETEVNDFGWAAPPVSDNPPPDNLYHVRIDNLGGGLYGYVSSGGTHGGFVGDNPNTSWDDEKAYASCMVLNNDYTGFPGSPQRALDATTAHEFNHSIQYGYGALHSSYAPDMNFIEGGATWMEDEVYDNSDDNHNYLWPEFDQCMGAFDGNIYAYWITFRGMTERFGTNIAGGSEDVMQDFWEETSKGTGENLSAMNTALNNKGITLADAYHDYAIAVKFNKTCGGNYTLPHCFEEAASYVSKAGHTSVHGYIDSIGDSYTGYVEDNYALSWVSLPTASSGYDVTLENTSEGGEIRTSVVCDTGTTLVVYPFSQVVGVGQSSTLAGFYLGNCQFVVAVITNQSQTADDPYFCVRREYNLTVSNSTTPINTPTDTPTSTSSAQTSTPTPSSTPTNTPTPSHTPTLTPIPNPVQVVFIQDDYLYLVEENNGENNFVIKDLTNPGSPIEVGNLLLEDTIYDIFVLGNYAYVSFGNQGLKVIDISNPANPAVVGTYNRSAKSFSQRQKSTETTNNTLPLEHVEINGLSLGFINTTYPFEVKFSPINASTPMTYTWSPPPFSGQGTSQANYHWPCDYYCEGDGNDSITNGCNWWFSRRLYEYPLHISCCIYPCWCQ
ncbi:MAG: hypothetical protein B6242_12720 [Anaerolineaceae bacterium 4572_78]|nr:MAG: hypothetical protein B6242_12720 [Anaerolineaceae bacterium 4572_78]